MPGINPPSMPRNLPHSADHSEAIAKDERLSPVGKDNLTSSSLISRGRIGPPIQSELAREGVKTCASQLIITSSVKFVFEDIPAAQVVIL